MKLYGLKDEQGVEYILNVPSYDVEPVIISKPKPELKVGDWIIECMANPSIGRIFRIENNIIYFSYIFNSSYRENWNYLNNLRLATEEEIKNHLKKICDEKYIDKRVRCLSSYSDIQTIRHMDNYDYLHDRMWYSNGFGTNTLVYCNGEFAEIIKDKTKVVEVTDEEIAEKARSLFPSTKNITETLMQISLREGYMIGAAAFRDGKIK
jgi:hypothetical protein